MGGDEMHRIVASYLCF